MNPLRRWRLGVRYYRVVGSIHELFGARLPACQARYEFAEPLLKSADERPCEGVGCLAVYRRMTVGLSNDHVSRDVRVCNASYLLMTPGQLPRTAVEDIAQGRNQRVGLARARARFKNEAGAVLEVRLQRAPRFRSGGLCRIEFERVTHAPAPLPSSLAVAASTCATAATTTPGSISATVLTASQRNPSAMYFGVVQLVTSIAYLSANSDFLCFFASASAAVAITSGVPLARLKIVGLARMKASSKVRPQGPPSTSGTW